MGTRLRNSKHERFAHAVAALAPYDTAYREAGFSGDPRWHRYNASKLANKPDVKARIDELRTEFERTCAHGALIHADYVRASLLPLIEADAVQLYEGDPKNPGKLKLRDIEKLPPHVTKAISRIKLDAETGRPVEIILHDKAPAVATLLRSLPGGSGPSVAVSVNASAQAAAGVETRDMSSAELARRVSWLIEQAAAETGAVQMSELGEGEPPLPLGGPDPSPLPPAAPAARERARAAVQGVVNAAQELRGDPEMLRWMGARLAETLDAIRQLAPTGAA